jgi:hypothetical protein
MAIDTPTTWQTFVEESRAFFDANRGSPLYGLIEKVEGLYRAALAKAPLPKTPTERDNLVQMCFLICHRALASAATSTASGLPEDGVAITRRALEAAKVALAITIDPANLEEWRALNKRTGRWKDRGKGVKPKGGPISPQYKGLSTETLYEDLTGIIAILSDYTVHFTPEHVLAYEWQQIKNKDGTTDMAFGVDEDAVPHGLLMLVDQHRLILRVFNRCFDGKLYRDAAVQAVAQRAFAQYKDMLAKEGLTEELKNVGDVW